MPLLRPERHLSGQVRLTQNICPSCPEAWFRSGFGEQEVQGLWVRLENGTFAFADIPLAEAYDVFGDKNVFVGGYDGYYLAMDEARQAIGDRVHGVHYVDDFNTEFQDFFVVCDDDDHTPYAEAHVAELIR